MKLGVNIDHIATLRQARLEMFPDPIEAAKEAVLGGADGVVCHLREDRRHVQPDDVKRLRELKTRLDFEMAAIPDIVKYALKIKPDYVTLVPEKRKEITTEGGLDVVRYRSALKPIIKRLQDNGIDVALFVDPIISQVEESAVLGAKFIEIHTGAYANAQNDSKKESERDRIYRITEKAKWIGLRVNAGHGLDYKNVGQIAEIDMIEELNIGFSIIARAVIVGMKTAVSEMKQRMKQK